MIIYLIEANVIRTRRYYDYLSGQTNNYQCKYKTYNMTFALLTPFQVFNEVNVIL